MALFFAVGCSAFLPPSFRDLCWNCDFFFFFFKEVAGNTVLHQELSLFFNLTVIIEMSFLEEFHLGSQHIVSS